MATTDNNNELIKLHEYKNIKNTDCRDLYEPEYYEKEGNIYILCKDNNNDEHCKFYLNCIFNKSDLKKVNDVNKIKKFHRLQKSHIMCNNFLSRIDKIYYDPKTMMLLVKCNSADEYCYNVIYLHSDCVKKLTENNINTFIAEKYSGEKLKKFNAHMNRYYVHFSELHKFITNYYRCNYSKNIMCVLLSILTEKHFEFLIDDVYVISFSDILEEEIKSFMILMKNATKFDTFREENEILEFKKILNKMYKAKYSTKSVFKKIIYDYNEDTDVSKKIEWGSSRNIIRKTFDIIFEFIEEDEIE